VYEALSDLGDELPLERLYVRERGRNRRRNRRVLDKHRDGVGVGLVCEVCVRRGLVIAEV
jgi:hypothetical protein